MSNGPIDITRNPIHLPDDARSGAFALEDFNFDGPSFEAYVDTHCSAEAPGRLMMIESTPVNWPSWERTEQAISFSAGSTIINPPGVWHTADVDEPMTAIYITPCLGTEGKSR